MRTRPLLLGWDAGTFFIMHDFRSILRLSVWPWGCNLKMTLNGAKFKDDTKRHALSLHALTTRTENARVGSVEIFDISRSDNRISAGRQRLFSLCVGWRKWTRKERGPYTFFCMEGNWELYVFPRLMAAYSEEGSLCEAAPDSKIAGATDRKKKKKKKKKRKPRGPTAWHRLTTQMSQAQWQKSMKFTL